MPALRIVLVALGTSPAEAESAKNQAHAELDEAKARAGGEERFVFGKRGATHDVIWTEDVAPRRMPKPVPRRAPAGG
ncbi:MAG: hypothetical protein OEQ13_02235 [Acidobacteriota bacterium]|nr:hypothetical protein [Acidobacteriota bacterium]